MGATGGTLPSPAGPSTSWSPPEGLGTTSPLVRLVSTSQLMGPEPQFPPLHEVASAQSPSRRASGPLDPIAMPLCCRVLAGLHQAVEECGVPGQAPVPVPLGPPGTGSVLKGPQSSVLPLPQADSLRGSGLGRPQAPGTRTCPVLLCRGETRVPMAGTVGPAHSHLPWRPASGHPAWLCHRCLGAGKQLGPECPHACPAGTVTLWARASSLRT